MVAILKIFVQDWSQTKDNTISNIRIKPDSPKTKTTEIHKLLENIFHMFINAFSTIVSEKKL